MYAGTRSRVGRCRIESMERELGFHPGNKDFNQDNKDLQLRQNYNVTVKRNKLRVS